MQAIYGVYLVIAIGAFAAIGYPMLKGKQNVEQAVSACARISDLAEQNACMKKAELEMKELKALTSVVVPKASPAQSE
nr:hypothetical protein [Pseudomonas sp.]